MITAIFWYSDGSTVEREFDSKADAQWFAANEGDHLDYWEFAQDDGEVTYD
jgi:hypothetical protein